MLEEVALHEDSLITGPSGCGKTFLAEQIARHLSIEFGCISFTAGVGESALTGRFMPTGEEGAWEYGITRFLYLYENGGLFLMDEMDAADPNVLLVVNTALSNGYIHLPCKDKPVIYRHPEFSLLATTNTAGRGADRVYAGRNALDAATWDRFQAGLIEMDFDTELERALTTNHELLEAAWAVRKQVRDNDIRRVPVSTRTLIKVDRKMDNKGWDVKRAVQQFVAGWTDREKEQSLPEAYR